MWKETYVKRHRDMWKETNVKRHRYILCLMFCDICNGVFGHICDISYSAEISQSSQKTPLHMKRDLWKRTCTLTHTHSNTCAYAPKSSWDESHMNETRHRLIHMWLRHHCYIHMWVSLIVIVSFICEYDTSSSHSYVNDEWVSSQSYVNDLPCAQSLTCVYMSHVTCVTWTIHMWHDSPIQSSSLTGMCTHESYHIWKSDALARVKTLQNAERRGNTLQHTTTRCNTLWTNKTLRNTLQHTATHSEQSKTQQHTVTHSTL